ncbi:MAG: hypothetical protein KGD57_00445 [Candidatus Lokiarchaeota archaeon]|nr:hypothetical protein [Candidatus Lokiarchaeota archaeon]
MTQKTKYSFDYIKELVYQISLKKTTIEGMLIVPKNAQELKFLAKKLNTSQSNVPLKVKCLKCDNEWNTKGIYLGRGVWPCQYCKNNTYTFKTIKDAVKSISKEKTGFEGKLLFPRDENEWKNAINDKERNKRPSRIKLDVQCKACGNKWSIEARALVSDRKWCKKCMWNILTFEKLKKLTFEIGLKKTGLGGILVRPKNEYVYQRLIDNARETIKSLKIKKNDPRYKKLQPRRISIKIKCKVCENIFNTNAESLKANKFCPKCASSEYEHIICWYASKIFSNYFNSKVSFPKIQLSEIIKVYDVNRYSKEELIAIKNLIRKGGGHLDGYDILNVNGSILRIGIEYNGEYHREVKKYLRMTERDLNYRMILDRLKKELCEQNDIILITINHSFDPYLRYPKKIQEKIINKFEKLTGFELNRAIIPQYNHQTPEFGQYRLEYFLKPYS